MKEEVTYKTKSSKRFVSIDKKWALFLFVFLLTISLQMPVQAAKLNKKQLVLSPGQTATLKLQKAKGSVKWSSSNKKVCKVKKGKVTAVKIGKAKIKATMKKKGKKKKTYTCAVKVVSKDVATTKVDDNNFCGTTRMNNYGRRAAVYASQFIGKGYYDMPEEIRIGADWCASFAKYMYSDTNKMHNSVTNWVKDANRDGRFHITSENGKDFGSADASYEPQIGDCVIYEEDERYYDFDHIGVVADKRWCEEHQRWEIVSIEGNYFEVSGDISKYDYCNKSLVNSFENRTVGRIDFEDIRYGMIAGYISPAFNEGHDYVVGDINGDRKVDSADVLIMKKVMRTVIFQDPQYYYTEKLGYMSPIEVFYRCDIDGNGYVSQVDWTYLLRYILGTYEPPER